MTNVGGIMEMRSLSQQLEDERAAAEKEAEKPIITGIAGHIRRCWNEARSSKEQKVEKQMLKNLRQRRGEYDADMLATLQEQGSAVVYMLLTSNKCRSAAAWLREALGGMPWSAAPTPVADIDETTKSSIVGLAEQEIQKAMAMGIFPSDAEVRGFMLARARSGVCEGAGDCEEPRSAYDGEDEGPAHGGRLRRRPWTPSLTTS